MPDESNNAYIFNVRVAQHWSSTDIFRIDFHLIFQPLYGFMAPIPPQNFMTIDQNVWSDLFSQIHEHLCPKQDQYFYRSEQFYLQVWFTTTVHSVLFGQDLKINLPSEYRRQYFAVSRTVSLGQTVILYCVIAAGMVFICFS